MAELIKMPRLSDTMEEGTVASWFKKVGDKVSEGDILAEIETDKATMEFESFYDGTLLYIGVKEGESTKVDEPLAIIGEANEDYKSLLDDAKKSDEVIEEKIEIKEEDKEIEVVKEELEIENVPEPISKTTSSTKRIFISPLARKLAKERGINISEIKGTGENGRIIKSDVENYTSSSKDAKSKTFVGIEDFQEIPHSQMRKTIAKRLSESKFNAPHYYLTVEYDMSNAIIIREQYNSIPDIKISYNDIIIKACSLALASNPKLNSQWFDDKIRYNNHIHIGVAVGVDEGLIVPVLKFVDQMSIVDINSKVKDLAGRARNKKLTPEEMQGSTFTISNLGMFDIESFTSIINPPNSVILSVGSIVQKPIVKNGNIEVGNTMKVTLACDHRVVDGLTGSKFLQTLREFIENPITMII
ncbi:MAG: dihydrolipoamide acetyltransferase family protein [Bacteroidota bacterium]|nr:dihydrolipoamide acetyltransferase family protein [Bacteroidota bacterium]|tara:strand:+ start:502 stop:1746 length:1245 start_codon:yes stop_codon:yes gene_type:complete